MRLLTKEDISKNNVDTISQYKILDYLKHNLNVDEFYIYLQDKDIIKVVDKLDDTLYFSYDKDTKSITYEDKINNIDKDMGLWWLLKYIIIPDFILENNKLNPTAKLLMGIINSLSFKDNVCFASNEYFSKKLKVSKRTITSSLSILKQENLIGIEVINHLRTIYLNYDNTKYSSTSMEDNF